MDRIAIEEFFLFLSDHLVATVVTNHRLLPTGTTQTTIGFCSRSAYTPYIEAYPVKQPLGRRTDPFDPLSDDPD